MVERLMPRSYQISWVRGQTPEIVFPAFYEAQAEKVMERIEQLAELYADLIVAWMRENAAWEDQTGDARDGLWAEARRFSQDKIAITFGHGADIYYGWYLESNTHGTYEIVGPALNLFSAMIEDDLRRLARIGL